MKHRKHFESLESRQLLSGLTSAEVTEIISAAAAVSLNSQTIVVVDTAGDVLGMYGQQPLAANETTSATNASGLTRVNSKGNLAGALVPNTAAKYALINATAEARTAAFFASTQDAFTTRTARFIIQNDFPQPIVNTEAGPLLGVEFSNAAGTDALPPGIGTGIAAGLSGNPGGIPLFINGQPVGAIGVAGDGNDVAPRQDLVPLPVAGVPANMQSPAVQSDPTGAYYTGNEEADFDEAVAQAGANAGPGFAAPSAIQATNILVNGLRFPFVAEGAATVVNPQPSAYAPGLTDGGMPYSALPARQYFSYAPFGYTAPVAISDPGVIYPSTKIELPNGSTIEARLANNSPAAGGAGVNAAVPAGTGFAPVYNADGSVTWVSSAAADAAINPTFVQGATVTDPASPAVGTNSGLFGFVPGASVDGLSDHLSKKDLLQIVSQAILESQSIRGAIRVPGDVPAQVYVSITDTEGNILTVCATPDATDFSFDVAVQKARTAAFFSDDTHAFSSRAIGFLADSTIPPAIANGATGPLYQLQESLGLDLNGAVFKPDITEVINGVPTVVQNPLGNGITIFPGGAPLYKNGHLVGAIGISGDGVDQDDLISYAGTAGFRAPAAIQDDSLTQADVTAFITSKIEGLGYTPPKNSGMPSFAFPTISFLQTQAGIDDPDVLDGNPDNIALSPNDTIITRILERLGSSGLDGVHLPFQKFPRNPGL